MASRVTKTLISDVHLVKNLAKKKKHLRDEYNLHTRRVRLYLLQKILI